MPSLLATLVLTVMFAGIVSAASGALPLRNTNYTTSVAIDKEDSGEKAGEAGEIPYVAGQNLHGARWIVNRQNWRLTAIRRFPLHISVGLAGIMALWAFLPNAKAKECGAGREIRTCDERRYECTDPWAGAWAGYCGPAHAIALARVGSLSRPGTSPRPSESGGPRERECQRGNGF